MQRAEHQVSRQCCLNRDFGRFQVTDFTHQNRVRILPQNGSQAACECNPHIRVDGNLDDAVDVIFDRIFRGDQLVGNIVEFGQ